MNRWRALVIGALFACSGCHHVMGSVAGQSTVNGEAWYVKTHSLFGLVYATSVYYCPPPESKKQPAVCTEAMIHDEN